MESIVSDGSNFFKYGYSSITIFSFPSVVLKKENTSCHVLKLNSTEITPSSTRRLTELEMQLSKIDDNIAIEEFKAKNKLTKEKIIEYLKQGSNFNMQKIIFRYIDKIILFDDKIEVYYNFKKKENPDDNLRDYSYSDGSNKSLMVSLVDTLRGLPFPTSGNPRQDFLAEIRTKFCRS